jgi:hypothetical protein
MLREIAKIANKLDSLGLTKEADILDTYLSKTAAGMGRYIKKSPPPEVAAAFKKWLNVSQLANYRWKGGLTGGIDSFIPSSGNLAELRGPEGLYNQISLIFSYTPEELNRDNGDDLYMWYHDNVHGNGDFLSEDLSKLAGMLREVASGMKARLPEIAGNYNGLAGSLEIAAEEWKARKPGRKTSESPSGEVSPEGAPVAIQAPSVGAKPSASPSHSSDPWAVYGTQAKDLKSAWLARTTATKKNPSFANFKAWLRGREVDSKDAGAIMNILVAETTGAGRPSALDTLNRMPLRDAT